MQHFLISLAVFATLVSPFSSYAAKKWQGEIPEVAQSPDRWRGLVKELMEKELYYGTLAAAERIITFFSDLPSKDLAYRTIVDLVEKGYPFSTKELFVTGDLEPRKGENFIDTYFLYKGLTNKQKGAPKWSQYYFDKLDKEKSIKFRFYLAVEKYKRLDLKGSAEDIEKLLSEKYEDNQRFFVTKLVRTLARIYFEQEQYEKSLDLYDNFLLKLNPIRMSDWTEASWNLYYLKRYKKALGYLFNLEAESTDRIINLENYVLRALVYREHCSTKSINRLVKSFNYDFGRIIKGIKNGEPLRNLATLKHIFHPNNQKYYQIHLTLDMLKKEEKKLKTLPRKYWPIARYLYKTEYSRLHRVSPLYEDGAVKNTANHLITLAENIRFLAFEVEREKFNPDVVFKSKEEEPIDLVEKLPDGKYLIKWLQRGDFWRDERHSYRARIKDKCGG